MDYNRRHFLREITTAALGAAGAYWLPNQKGKERSGDQDFAVIPQDGTILFQGDSITDAGRSRDDENPNSGLGGGYAFLVAAKLRKSLAERNINCYNRGISGNKVFQLSERWQEDALSLKPDLLSILIGVNDFWHTLNDYDGTAKVYEDDLRALLRRTRERLPEAALVIGEPFVILEGSSVNQEEWMPDFQDYQKAARQIAREFDAAFISYQSVFDKASQKVSPTYWTGDGVHPTLAGSQLMAEAWLQTVNRM